MKVADVIREARRARNLTRSQLSHLSGVPETTLVHLEQGRTQPRIDTVLKLLQAMHLQFLVIDYHHTQQVTETRPRRYLLHR